MYENVVLFPITGIEKEINRDKDRDLPKDAVRITGNLLDIVREAHDAVRKLHIEHERILVDYKDIFSGQNYIDSGDCREETRDERLRLFNGISHPIVDGSTWYRGISIPVDEGTVLFYLPWIQEGDPYPKIYFLGKVSSDSIVKLVNEYSRRIFEIVSESAPKHQKRKKPHLTVI